MPQYQSLIMIALLVVGFYFLILRPQKKRQQAVQKTMRELEPGARVLLNSGIFGTIVSLGDRQTVIEIAPGVELTVLKASIARAATENDEDQPYVDDDELDEIEEPEQLDRPTSTFDLPPTHSTPAPSSAAPSTSTPSTSTPNGADAYQPSSTYSSSDTESTVSGVEPTNPTSR